MSLIDMHTHTTASDGTFSPSELTALAIEKKLSAIAITDHDTVSGIKEGIESAEGSELMVVPGIELSCDYGSTEIHILGYFIQWQNPLLLKRLQQLRESRFNRNKQMLKNLNNAGIPLTEEQLHGGNPQTTVTRAHFARAMVEFGYVKSRQDVFDKYIGENCPYYVPKPTVDPAYAIRIIREAGGAAVLAHPLLYHMGYDELAVLFHTLKENGLMGIEVYHSSANSTTSGRIRELARKEGLLPTGGSDFHGANKPDIQLGSGRAHLFVSHLLLRDLYDTLISQNELC